jgi:hypothetical protein
MSTCQKCYAQRHMSPAEYGFWDQCRKLAHSTRILHFDGRAMAKRFKQDRGSGYRTMYRLRDSLVEAGWLVEVDNNCRKTDGTFENKSYLVLSHAEWATAHGERDCRKSLWSDEENIEPVTSLSQARLFASDTTVTGPVTSVSSACDKTGADPVTPASHRLNKTSLTINQSDHNQIDRSTLNQTDVSFENALKHTASTEGCFRESTSAPSSDRGGFNALIYTRDDYSGKMRWSMNPDANRSATPEEVAEIQRRNISHVKPTSDLQDLVVTSFAKTSSALA